MAWLARRLDAVRRPGRSQDLATGTDECDPAVVATEAPPPHPGHLAESAQLIEQSRLVAGDPGGQDVAFQDRGRDREPGELVDDLGEALDRSVAAGEGATRLVAELEERLTRLERRERGVGAPATVAAQPSAAAIPDYFAFESRMRGSTAAIRARQQVYLDDFRAAAPVLDVGCGRGEFLELLRDAGVEATGVDADADMAAYAQGEGLDVVQADALAHLAALPDGSLGGIFASQLVEHLPPAVLYRLLELAVAKLRPGGLLVA